MTRHLKATKLLPKALATLAFVLLAYPLTAYGLDLEQFGRFLRQRASADDEQLKRLSQPGGVFANIIPSSLKGEVAVAGAVRIPVTIDFFIDRFRGIETFQKDSRVQSIGKFSDPPQRQDLRRLVLGQKELDALGKCKPGDCRLKLSDEMMHRLRDRVANHRRGADLDGDFREVLFEYLSRYIDKGTPGMIAYSDTDPPVRSSRRFLELLEQFHWMERDVPVLFETLRNSGHAHPEISEFFYWSKNDFGLKPVVTVTDVCILKTTIEGKPWAFVASKQIYADHYFEASLGLTVLAQESADPVKASTSVAYFNRSETDGLKGWLASIQRSIVERRVRAALEKSLSDMKEWLDKDYRNRNNETPHGRD